MKFLSKFLKRKKDGDEAKEGKKSRRARRREERDSNEPKYESEVAKFFFYRGKDKKEFKTRRVNFGKEAVPVFIEGVGGLKNIISIKAKGMAIVVQFRSRYRIKEDILRQAGGLHLWIGEGELIEVFDYLEVKTIVSTIKSLVKKERARLFKLEVA